MVLVVYKHRLHPVFQTRLECGSLSAYTHQFPALCFKHVWIMVPCLGTSICLLLPWSNTFGLRFLVCVRECVQIVDLCLCTRIRLQPCSNTFDYGCLFVYPPRTKMKVTPELEKILQTHAVFLCGFLNLSRYRADLPSGMSIMQRFELLGSIAGFVRDAPLRPSPTQGVELFFPLFSECGAAAICPEPDVHSWF